MNYTKGGMKCGWPKEIGRGFIFLALPLISFCTNVEFEQPPAICTDNMESNISYSDLKVMAAGEIVQIQQDLVIEGIIVSSDRAGNFFNSIHIQESNAELSEGIELSLELPDSHLFYPPGLKIYVKLRSLYIQMKKGNCRIGSAMNSFGSLSVARIPKAAINNHIYLSCQPEENPTPMKIHIDSINPSHINTLVELNNLEFTDQEIGETYAEPKKETNRALGNCNGKIINLINSGYSDFHSEILPEGNGSVHGIIVRQGNDFAIKIRNTDDILFDNERCIDQFPPVSSNSVFISEIADPINESGGRFVELYNSSEKDVLLSGWELRRYTNGSTQAGNNIDLSGYEIKSRSTLVISSDVTSFESIYGFVPDVQSNLNSAADSNGDDNLELVDPFDSVIDRFGIPGEDGSGTNHEFENGGAFRLARINSASQEYIFEEWLVYNDTGAEGTIKQTLNAPEDFSPGVR